MFFPGHGHDRAQKVVRKGERCFLTPLTPTAYSRAPVTPPAEEDGRGVPLRDRPGPCLSQTHTHTEITYTLTHMGGSLLGICPWITPTQLPRDTSPSSCPVSLKQNSILLECHGGLRTRCVSALTQGGQSLEGQGAMSWPSTEIKKRQMNTMWVSPSAIAYEHSKFSYNEVPRSGGGRCPLPCRFLIHYTWTWWPKNIT